MTVTKFRSIMMKDHLLLNHYLTLKKQK